MRGVRVKEVDFKRLLGRPTSAEGDRFPFYFAVCRAVLVPVDTDKHLPQLPASDQPDDVVVVVSHRMAIYEQGVLDLHETAIGLRQKVAMTDPLELLAALPLGHEDREQVIVQRIPNLLDE